MPEREIIFDSRSGEFIRAFVENPRTGEVKKFRTWSSSGGDRSVSHVVAERLPSASGQSEQIKIYELRDDGSVRSVEIRPANEVVIKADRRLGR